MGFGFTKEEREAIVAFDLDRLLMPLPSDRCYNWARCHLAAPGKRGRTLQITSVTPAKADLDHLGTPAPPVPVIKDGERRLVRHRRSDDRRYPKS